MSWRYAILNTLIILALLVAKTPTLLLDSESIPISKVDLYAPDDSESRLAQGEKLLLECADIAKLELIKGISDTLAAELIATRYDIMRMAIKHPHSEAIKLAHGVGEKTAAHLLRYIDLTTRCDLEQEFTNLPSHLSPRPLNPG